MTCCFKLFLFESNDWRQQPRDLERPDPHKKSANGIEHWIWGQVSNLKTCARMGQNMEWTYTSMECVFIQMHIYDMWDVRCKRGCVEAGDDIVECGFLMFCDRLASHTLRLESADLNVLHLVRSTHIHFIVNLFEPLYKSTSSQAPWTVCALQEPLKTWQNGGCSSPLVASPKMGKMEASHLLLFFCLNG